MNTGSLLTVRDYLRMMFRRKFVLFAPILLSLLLVGPLWMIVPPKYRATSLVKRKDMTVITAAPDSLISRASSAVSLRTLRVEILTWTNLNRVIREFNLDRDLKTDADWQRKYAELTSSISIRAVAHDPGVDVIEIAAIANYPEEASRIADAIADNYIEDSKSIERQDSRSTVEFYQAGFDKNHKKLRELETDLDRYRQQNYTDLPEVRNSILSSINGLKLRESTLLLQIADAQNRLVEVEKQLAEVSPTIQDESTSMVNPGALDLQGQLLARRKSLETMLVDRTAEHPDVKRLRDEIKFIEEQLAATPNRLTDLQREVTNPLHRELSMDRLKLQQEIKGHEAGIRSTRVEMAALDDKIKKVVGDEKRYMDLVRERNEVADTREQYRKGLLTARTKHEAQAGQYGTQIEMFSRALPPTAPWRLERMKLVVACLGGGVGLGVALMFLLEFCDHSLRSAEDAAAFLAMPVLGTLSVISDPKEEARRRRRLLFGSIAVVVGLALLVAGLWFLESVRPGAFNALLRPVQSLLR